LSNEKPETPTATAPQPPQNQAAEANAAGQATTPPPAKPAPVTPSDTHKTTNYDIDKTVQFLEHPSWKLRGINIAVLVNNPTGSPLPAERLQSVTKLVTSAIGAGQNPHVTVVDLPFETADGSVAAPGGPWWKEAWTNAVGQNALLAAAGLFALFGGLFPLLRRVTGAQATVTAATAAKVAAIRAGLSGDSDAAANSGLRPLPRARNEPQDIFAIEAETVQSLVTSDPARTAQVIRGWIAGDRSSLKRA
jgi:flagellar biosynthesis/type III secretory pathway M-ring protein FliF/YscJ